MTEQENTPSSLAEHIKNQDAEDIKDILLERANLVLDNYPLSEGQYLKPSDLTVEKVGGPLMLMHRASMIILNNGNLLEELCGLYHENPTQTDVDKFRIDLQDSIPVPLGTGVKDGQTNYYLTNLNTLENLRELLTTGRVSRLKEKYEAAKARVERRENNIAYT